MTPRDYKTGRNCKRKTGKNAGVTPLQVGENVNSNRKGLDAPEGQSYRRHRRETGKSKGVPLAPCVKQTPNMQLRRLVQREKQHACLVTDNVKCRCNEQTDLPPWSHQPLL